MWVFYLISLPLTLGMVFCTLKYFAGPDVPKYVLVTVGYTWFCSLSIIILVPADIWTTLIGLHYGVISFFWSWSYWSTFLLTWAVAPIMQGYEDSGDFTVSERLKTSVHENLVFYVCVGSIGLFGLILVVVLQHGRVNVLGLAMACSNTFGLVTGAFLLGFGLSEIPKSIWRNADWIIRQKVLSHKVAKMAVKLDDAHQQLSNAIVVAQATSKQMSKRDPLRPYMNVIDNMLANMLTEDPSFKPQGGRLGENDMDYDSDEKSMAALRRQLKRAREEYYRYKSEYMNYVTEALELEDTMKNYERRDSTGWKYISSFRKERMGRLGSLLDTIEFVWLCILRKQVQKALALIFGCISAAILLAEATILLSGVNLSLFSMLVNAVGKEEVFVQVAAFVPLMYMCICTYYSLFKVGMLTFYSLTPRQTSSVSLLMICSMVARYAPPICYNFLYLIHLEVDRKRKETVFEQRMGSMDNVPFFGEGFNKIYPLIMVIYTLLIASNFFDRVIEYFGNWKIFRLQREADNTDGYDPSGMIILQRERSWLEQGHKVGELVIPLARNFNNTNEDPESGTSAKAAIDMKGKARLLETDRQDYLESLKTVTRNETTRESMGKKYASIRTQQAKQEINAGLIENPIAEPPATGIASSTWESMKTGLQSLKTNIGGAKKFLPLKQVQDPAHYGGNSSSTESLDEIFQRLRRPTAEHRSIRDDFFDDDDDAQDGRVMEVKKSGATR
ncbi:LMBR1 domain-containing protein 2 homolog A-like [Impatiens glandulifera]|uniref:LMBR1 domain-containing protein 2 homolog A-like n=1 Tax=Impatiens glandulifera TaxID=253017 RepID=UPI001FB16500|nr:LMBR1 domain-containing protein 2 homolog A-like [Impatiens glandulifera]